MSDPGAREAGKQDARSSAMLALVLGSALVFPGMATAGGKAIYGYSIPGMAGTRAAAPAATGTAMGHSGMAKALKGAPSSGGSTAVPFSQNSPTTMATSPFSPTLMATASADQDVALRANANIIYGRSGSRNIGHASMAAASSSSWASSGTVWPTATPAGGARHSSGKGPSMPKPVTLATWPAVDTSASANTSTH